MKAADTTHFHCICFAGKNVEMHTKSHKQHIPIKKLHSGENFMHVDAYTGFYRDTSFNAIESTHVSFISFTYTYALNECISSRFIYFWLN